MFFTRNIYKTEFEVKQLGSIIVRELKTRIRKKSFIISTILGPVFFLFISIVPLWMNGVGTAAEKAVVINDPENVYFNNKTTDSEIWNIDSESAKSLFLSSEKELLVLIPRNWNIKNEIEIISKKPSFPLIESIKKQVENTIITQLTETKVTFNTQLVPNADKTDEIRQTLALLLPIFIYFFIFLYGMQVMKGVIEEKSNRIYEVLLCIVHPWKLMIGKILGIGSLSIIQFSIWIIFHLIIYKMVAGVFHFDSLENLNVSTAMANNPELSTALEFSYLVNGFQQLPLLLISGLFVFYFVSAYLLYASLFTIVGAASDQDTETQQFIFPITAPLLLTFVFLGQITDAPFSALAKAFSYFPLTSPLAMMARISIVKDISEILPDLIISMVSIWLFIALAIFAASKIYRKGILQFGGKIGYRTLFSWIKTKNI